MERGCRKRFFLLLNLFAIWLTLFSIVRFEKTIVGPRARKSTVQGLVDYDRILKLKETNEEAVHNFLTNVPAQRSEHSRRTREQDRRRKNVLFIMADDLRAQISPYQDGDDPQFPEPRLITPNFQRLASQSLLLKNAFVQYSLCGPSRASMLTSRRPDTTRVYENDQNWRETGGDFTTLPQYFKRHGYYTMGTGKLFHPRSSSHVDPLSWSRHFIKVPSTEQVHMKRFRGSGAGWLQVTKHQEETLPLTDTLATQQLKRLLVEHRYNSSREPFFFGIGFKKPHFSYVCPKQYYDLYPLERERQFMSNISWQEPEVRPTCGIFNATHKTEGKMFTLPGETLRRVRQGYFACISYIDALLGEILDTVEALGLTDSTIVSFVSDHGFHLGENNMLGKLSLFEATTRVPMMLRVPGKTDGGLVSTSIVEAVDLFPTLVEVAGLEPVPPCPKNSTTVRTCTQGTSFAALFNDVDRPTKKAALSQIQVGEHLMKYSIRTARFRYSALVHETEKDEHEVYSENIPEHPEELYDHRHDREERYNLVQDPAHSGVRSQLRQQLLHLQKS